MFDDVCWKCGEQRDCLPIGNTDTMMCRNCSQDNIFDWHVVTR